MKLEISLSFSQQLATYPSPSTH